LYLYFISCLSMSSRNFVEEVHMKTEIKIISTAKKLTKEGKPYTVVYAEIVIANETFVRKFYLFS